MTYQQALAKFNLSPNFTEEQLKKVYRKLIKQYHPDLYEQKPYSERLKAESIAKDINEAYDILLKSMKKNSSKYKTNVNNNFDLENKKAEYTKYFKAMLDNANKQVDYSFRNKEKTIIVLAIYKINKAQTLQELQNIISQLKSDLQANNVKLFDYYVNSYMPNCQKFFLAVNFIIKGYRNTLKYQENVSDVYRHFQTMKAEIEKTINHYQKIYKEQIENRLSTIIKMIINSNANFINKLSSNDLLQVKKALNEEKEELAIALLCVIERDRTGNVDFELDHEYSSAYLELEKIVKKLQLKFETNQKKVLNLIKLYENSDEQTKKKVTIETKVLLENLLNDNFEVMYDQVKNKIQFENKDKIDLIKIKKMLLDKLKKSLEKSNRDNEYYYSLLMAEMLEINEKLSQPNCINFEHIAELDNISFVDLKSDTEIIKRVFNDVINFNQDLIFISNDGHLVTAIKFGNSVNIIPLSSDTKFSTLTLSEFSQKYTPLSLFLKNGTFVGKIIDQNTTVLYVNKNIGICYNPGLKKAYFVDEVENIFSKQFHNSFLNYETYKNNDIMALIIEQYFGLTRIRHNRSGPSFGDNKINNIEEYIDTIENNKIFKKI